eukprot:gnl/MRDRNA2_/MRDRNA2_65009_c1_seq1.p1 gnl/MRDRNA2_/MRDRNA2_65009_c1~~gnl/MRDRNA2_/MRDRNA2_65009_c1_seq1.p1  ORF type:complete len:843 (-),score=165.61 gnl/MRDRNA2_/MRDRNA2_65009_c1_seq1:16-2544(-)
MTPQPTQLSGHDTAEMLRANLMGEMQSIETETWDSAQRMETAAGDTSTGVAPVDEIYTSCEDKAFKSLDTAQSFLTPDGREPTDEDVLKYLEKHKLQDFLTNVVMYIAKHFPPDPMEFLLDHVEAMVAKHRKKIAREKGEELPIAPLPHHTTTTLTPDQATKVVQRLAAVLRYPDLTKSSAEKIFRQFSGGEQMSEPKFRELLKHFENAWGLTPGDTKLMFEILKRWRFRANVTGGTRGLPLWPLSLEDFKEAYPSLLRYVRDKYAPIGGLVHRSMFIRQSTGKLEEKYDVGQKLGRGAYGDVFLCTLKNTTEKRVCKRCLRNMKKVPGEELAGEVDMLRSLDHPNIIRIYEFFETEDYLEMIMEPVYGGSFASLTRGMYMGDDGQLVEERPAALTESWVATAVTQLLDALRYSHEVVGLVHKDLKCDNVLLVAKPGAEYQEVLASPVHVVLCDFGISEIFRRKHDTVLESTGQMNSSGGSGTSSKKSQGTKTPKVGGTPSYMSPEMFKNSFNEKSDLWSLGTMIFRLMTGRLPYTADNILMQAHVVCSPRRHPPWELLSKLKWSLGARWFVQQLLSKDEQLRPSAAEALQDHWLVEARGSHNKAGPNDQDKHALLQHQLQSHLSKMALHCLTTQLSLTQLHRLNSLFTQYDSSRDGRLNHDEMRRVLADVGVSAGEDVELVIESLDGDHSGMIEYSEFMSGCIVHSEEDLRSQLRMAFDIFDLDDSGSINMDELRQVLTQGPNPERPTSQPGSSRRDVKDYPDPVVLPDGKTIAEIMADLDKNNSGKIEYHEFEAYVVSEHASEGKRLADTQARDIIRCVVPPTPPPDRDPNSDTLSTTVK